MSTPTAEEFFRTYERANSEFDVQSIANHYAEVFMFGSPQGVQAVKKEDFVKVLPRRKDFMKTAGLLSSRVHSIEAATLDSKYTLAKVMWEIRVLASDTDTIIGKVSATYMLSSVGDSLEIILQLDHQDLMKTVQELKAQSSSSA